MESLGPMQQKQAPEPAAQKPARVRILDAAHALMLSVGLAKATTKEIAKAAGCSEAALYKYFASKEELFISVLAERLPRLTPCCAASPPNPAGTPWRTTSPRSPARRPSSTSRASRSRPPCTPRPSSSAATTRHCGSSARAPTSRSRPWTPICAPNRPSAASAPTRTPSRPRPSSWAPAHNARSPTRRPGPAYARPWTSSRHAWPGRCWAESPLPWTPPDRDPCPMRHPVWS